MSLPARTWRWIVSGGRWAVAQLARLLVFALLVVFSYATYTALTTTALKDAEPTTASGQAQAPPAAAKEPEPKRTDVALALGAAAGTVALLANLAFNVARSKGVTGTPLEDHVTGVARGLAAAAALFVFGGFTAYATSRATPAPGGGLWAVLGFLVEVTRAVSPVLIGSVALFAAGLAYFHASALLEVALFAGRPGFVPEPAPRWVTRLGGVLRWAWRGGP